MPYVNANGTVPQANSSAAANLIPQASNTPVNNFSATAGVAGQFAGTIGKYSASYQEALDKMALTASAGYATAREQTWLTALETSKLGLTQQAALAAQLSVATQERFAALEQTLKTKEFTLTQQTLTQQIATEQRKYGIETQKLKSAAASRGATSSAGEATALQTLSQTNQAKLATLYRQKQLTTIAQQLGKYQYTTALKKLQTETKQLAIQAQKLGITKEEYASRLTFGISTMLNNGALTAGAYSALTKAGTLGSVLSGMRGTGNKLGLMTQTLLNAINLQMGTAAGGG
jgi:hypothetical protein